MAANVKKRAPASSNRPAKDNLLGAFETSPVTQVAERELKEFAVASSEMYETVIQQNSALLDQLEAQIRASEVLVNEGFDATNQPARTIWNPALSGKRNS